MSGKLFFFKAFTRTFHRLLRLFACRHWLGLRTTAMAKVTRGASIITIYFIGKGIQRQAIDMFIFFWLKEWWACMFFIIFGTSMMFQHQWARWTLQSWCVFPSQLWLSPESYQSVLTKIIGCPEMKLDSKQFNLYRWYLIYDQTQSVQWYAPSSTNIKQFNVLRCFWWLCDCGVSYTAKRFTWVQHLTPRIGQVQACAYCTHPQTKY